MESQHSVPLTFSFIIVNYKSAAHLPACFSSFRNITLSGASECIVVNNDPHEETALRELQTRFPFTLLSLPKNRGFGFAVNRAAEAARGKILLLLNPDARFLSGDLDDVAQRFKQNPSIGIIGFKLLLEPEMPQPWGAGTNITLSNLLRNHAGFPRSASIWKSKTIRRAAWVSGAALAVPRELFFQIHGFDERFFLYYEDADFCIRMKKFHKKIFLLPDVRILHVGGASMNTAREEQKKMYAASQDIYFSLHRPWYEGVVLKFLRGLIL